MPEIYQIFNDQFWYVAPILVAVSTALTGVINQLLNPNNTWKQIISWIVGAGLSCAAIALGFLGAEIGWASYVAMSIVVGLSSNGIYDIKFIHEWIDKWFRPSATKAA
jgi:hypothetical protein